MKMNITKIIMATLVTAIAFTSCKPDAFEEIGDKRDIPSSLAGIWKLVKVTQKDEEAARKGFPYSELDLTTVFPYTDFSLTLNSSGNTLTTFTTTPGNSPKVISLTSGTWAVDNGENPGAILFKNGAVTESVTLGSYPVGGNTKLVFKIEKRDADPAANNKLLISYTYEFSKQ